MHAFERTARHRRRSAEKQEARDKIWGVERKAEDMPTRVFWDQWVETGVLHEDGSLALPKEMPAAGESKARVKLVQAADVGGGLRVRLVLSVGAKETVAGPSELTPGAAVLTPRGAAAAACSRDRVERRRAQFRPPRDVSVDTLTLFIDGSGDGGWGVVVLESGGGTREYCGPVVTDRAAKPWVGAAHKTNNTAELHAMIEALYLLECEGGTGPAIIRPDSTYAMDAATGVAQKCKRNKAMVAKARELWESVSRQRDGKLYVDHVRAHRGHDHDERTDRLAAKGAEGTVWGTATTGQRWAGWPELGLSLRHRRRGPYESMRLRGCEGRHMLLACSTSYREALLCRPQMWSGATARACKGLMTARIAAGNRLHGREWNRRGRC